MSRPGRPYFAAAALVAVLNFPAAELNGQFTSPCDVRCALVLGGAGYAVGTGTLVAWGRASGGISTYTEAIALWGGGFAVTVGAAMALNGNGARQERAVYGAGLGVLAGSAAGVLVGVARAKGDGAYVVAATLIGAGAGALAGGIYGALSHVDEGSTRQIPLLAVRWTH